MQTLSNIRLLREVYYMPYLKASPYQVRKEQEK